MDLPIRQETQELAAPLPLTAPQGTSDYQATAASSLPPNLEPLQRKRPDVPERCVRSCLPSAGKRADILTRPRTELHWETLCASSGMSWQDATSAWGDKLAVPASPSPLPLPRTCSPSHRDSFLGEFMIQHDMKRLLPYQMAIINNYQMDARSIPPAHYFNRPDKDWILVFLFQAVEP